MDMKKSQSHLLLKVFACFAIIILILFALRTFHIILHVGGHYTFCFSEEYVVGEDRGVTDDNIGEIVYMKNLKRFSAIDTNLTNIDFITNFNELESLCIVGQSNNPKSIMNSIPSLRNAQNLEYVYLFCVNVEDLDFVSNNPSLKYLTVISEHAVISDLSGLKNKEKLQILELENVVCEDYSILLELTALEQLSIMGTPLPEEIKQHLSEKGVEVVEKEVQED